MLLKQENETPQQFGSRCQELNSLLMSNLVCTESNLAIRNVKIQLYDSLTLKSFLSGLREPLGSMIKSRNPISLESALTNILIEENINYTKIQN